MVPLRYPMGPFEHYDHNGIAEVSRVDVSVKYAAWIVE